MLFKHLTSSNWDARRAAAEALSYMLESVEKTGVAELKEESISEDLVNFNVLNVFTQNEQLTS